MRDNVTTITDLPRFVVRSVRSMGHTVIRDATAVMAPDPPQYDDVDVRNKIIDDAAGGKVDQDTWAVLYMAYRVAEKSRMRPNNIHPLRRALLKYVEDNETLDNAALVSYMTERKEVLSGINVRLGYALQSPGEHVEIIRRRK